MASRSVSIPHYAWAGGHIVVLLGTLYTLIGLVTFSARSKSYYFSFAGALLSWGIVVYKSLGAPQLNGAYIKRAMLDENVQYLVMALYWFMHKPIYVTLIPFATFSLFHTLTFIRTTVLPKPPSTKPAATKTAGGAAKPAAAPATASARVSKLIQSWVRANFEKAMLFVAYVEIVIVFGRVFLGAITFQNSIVMPILFAHFLRLRVYISTPTRSAFESLTRQVDTATTKPSCPAPVRKGFTILRDLVLRYVETVLPLPPTAPAAPAGGAPAAAPAR